MRQKDQRIIHERPDIRAIDIGCGNRPIDGCHAYVDLYPDEAVSRSAGKVPKGLPNFVEANIEDLPFEDGMFDFSYCCHVLEHVDDPEKAIQEIMRVSKAGYIETPSYFNEILFGKKYHKWAILWDERERVMRFYEKRALEDRMFNDFFIKVMERTNEGARYYKKNFHLFINSIKWENEIDYEIIRS